MSTETRKISFKEFMRDKPARHLRPFEVDLRFTIGIAANNHRTPNEWASLYEDFRTKNRAGRAA